MTLVNKACRLEQVRSEIGTIELRHLIQLHVEPLRFLRNFRVSKSINHVGQESLETSLFTTNSQCRMLDHLLDILLTRIEAQHDNLLDLVLEYFHDCR